MLNFTSPEALIQHLLPVKLEQLHSRLKSWYSSEALIENVKASLEDEVFFATDVDFRERFSRNAPVVGATPEMYANRMLELPHLGDSLCMIRFFGMDMARPFINIGWSSYLPVTFDALLEVGEALKLEFSVFKPLHVRMYVPSYVPLELGAGAYWEKRIVAAPIKHIASFGQPQQLERVRFERPEHSSFENEVRAMYEDLYASGAYHPDFAMPADAEDLEDYHAQGALWRILIDDEFAGMAGAYKHSLEGMRGFTVGEIVLSRAFRGRGFGGAVHRRFAQALEVIAKPDDALIGEIHSRNTQAIRSAVSSGREDLGGYAWLHL
jgi:GNAT superfamily N-acetyltransferase